MGWEVLSRRDLLKLGLVTAGSAALGQTIVAHHIKPKPDRWMSLNSPIDRTGRLPEWGGDNPTHAHGILWKPAEESQAPVENARIVIVGGGISGLTSAYLFRDWNPILLEQAPRFGGNAKGESIDGYDYPIGAAYCLEPTPGSKLQKLYSELEFSKMVWTHSDAEPCLYQTELRVNCDGPTTALRGHLSKVFHETEGLRYPEIPYTGASMKGYVQELDQMTFYQYIEKILKAAPSPELTRMIDWYGLSALNGTSREISAAAFINFMAGENGKLWVAPGGNAGFAERILERIRRKVASDRLRAGSTVTAIDVKKDGVITTYADAHGKIKRVRSEFVVVAIPKFIAKKVVRGYEAERKSERFQKLEYRPYLVCNMALDRRPNLSFYDLFWYRNNEAYADRPQLTDVLWGQWSASRWNRSVLSFYLPGFHTERSSLLDEEKLREWKEKAEEEIRAGLLPKLGLSPKNVTKTRWARWGHALPLAKQGIYASGVLEELKKPFQERVFFAQQDNWALPALETAMSEAIETFETIHERQLSFSRRGVRPENAM